jgi:uncharacterized small protein (DUF1192 family)
MDINAKIALLNESIDRIEKNLDKIEDIEAVQQLASTNI